MDFKNIVKRYQEELLDLKNSIIPFTNSVHINFSDPMPRENVPLYLVMDFAVKGREAEYDYGLCLTITFQTYDPEKGFAKYRTEELYVMSDLTRGDGQFVASFGPVIIKPGADFSLELAKAIDEVSKFIKDQKETIITMLRTY